MEWTHLKKSVSGGSSMLLILVLFLLISCGGDGDDNTPPVVVKPVKVSGTPTDRGLEQRSDVFVWAPDSSRIAYLARQASTSSELYTSTPDGTVNESVSPVPLPTDGDVDTFAWEPNSTRVAYIADQDTAGVIELYTSKLDGTDNQNVSRSAVFDILEIDKYAWAPPSLNSDTLVFIAKELNGNTYELYVSEDNGINVTVRKLSDPITNNGRILDFEISPDGQRVAYLSDQLVQGTYELYTVSIDGLTAPENISRLTNDVLKVSDFAWSPLNTRIAFLAFNPVSLNDELWTNSAIGGQPTKISRNIVPVNGNVTNFAWAPDGSLIAYIGDALVDEKFELFTTLPNTQSNFNPSGAVPDFADVTAFAWSPDSRLILFLADVVSVDVNELFVADPQSVNLTPNPISGGGFVSNAAWAPDSSRIAFIADLGLLIIQKFELFTVFPDGTSLLTVSDLTDDTSDVNSFVWSPDLNANNRIAYIADQDIAGVDELYTNNPLGTSPRKVSADLTPGQNVFNFSWAPDASLLAYQANQDDITKFELFTTLP